MYTLLYLQNGVVSLIDCTLMEDPEGTDDECECLVYFILAEIWVHNGNKASWGAWVTKKVIIRSLSHYQYFLKIS